jgi:hypothetical protein
MVARDTAAPRANKRRHVVHDNSLHVEERANIVIDEPLSEGSLTAYGATDLGGFGSHDHHKVHLGAENPVLVDIARQG